ncbi:DUF3575 domain-containing protein [Pleionea sediminis]|uniref:DUF3575 domain-containing protein n=1 Tax=Pleionea sediminis TaxID=2569479 RepID=UPI0013DE4659|nr:DUF3575 domain-containing protein [Pleionea sediminis]
MKYVSISLGLLFSTQAFAYSDNDNDIHYNASFGISPFYGIFGFEIKKSHHSLGIGLFDRVAYRYYSKPNSDSKFYGLYIGTFDEPTNGGTRYRGVTYHRAEGNDGGLGAGYRWQWPSGWNVTASISIHYMDKKYIDPDLPVAKESEFFLFPGIHVGYRF